MLLPKAPGESPSLLLPASGGCECKTLTSASVITWPSLLSVSIFCLCQSSLCLSVRTFVMYHLGSTFSLLQSTSWLAQISSQWGLELQCGFNWTKHQRCPKDVSLGAVSPEMPPDTWGSLEKGESHWVMIETLQTQHQCLSNFGKVIQPLSDYLHFTSKLCNSTLIENVYFPLLFLNTHKPYHIFSKGWGGKPSCVSMKRAPDNREWGIYSDPRGSGTHSWVTLVTLAISLSLSFSLNTSIKNMYVNPSHGPLDSSNLFGSKDVNSIILMP